MKINPAEVAVIADGGGKRGCHSVGFLSGFIDHFKQPIFADNKFYFQGSSVGALNLGFVAQSLDVKGLIDIWEKKIQTGKIRVFNKRTAIRLLRRHRRNAIFDNADLFQLVSENLDVGKVVNSPVYLDIVVTNERNDNHIEFFSNRDLHSGNHQALIKKICASASLMGVFEPLEIGGGLYSDGLNFDIDRAIARGCTTIFLFHNNHIWLSPIIPSEKMDFQRRGRRMSNIAWSRWVEIYLELLLWRHPELEIVNHSYLPKPISEVVKRIGLSGRGRLRLIVVGPQKIIPTLNIMTCLNGDATRAIYEARDVFEKIVKQI